MTNHPPEDQHPSQPGESHQAPAQGPHEPATSPHHGSQQPDPVQAQRAWRRRALAYGGGAITLVLAIAGVMVVWALSDSDGPYTSLPECDSMLTAEILESLPGVEDPQISTDPNESFTADSSDSSTPPLHCQVDTEHGRAFEMILHLVEPETMDATREHLTDEMDEMLSTGATSESGADMDIDELGVGDDGIISVHTGDRRQASAHFYMDNIVVQVHYYGFPEDFDMNDAPGLVEDLSGDLYREIAQAAGTE